jgi:hypothetical protein
VGLALVGRRQRVRALEIGKTRDLRTQEIERRLRGRSMLEQELQMEEVTMSNLLAALELPDLAAVEALVTAEEGHMGSIMRLRAQLEGLVGREPTETLPELRDKAALDVEQKTAPRGARADRQGARARERLEVAWPTPSGSQLTARDDEARSGARSSRTASTPRRSPRTPRRPRVWAEQLAALQRRARVYDATLRALDTAERATIRTATRYLEKTDGRRPGAGHRGALSPGQGRRRQPRAARVRTGARRLG